jgi:AraC-like DNA-binding protein
MSSNHDPVRLAQVNWERCQLRLAWVQQIHTGDKQHNASTYHPYYRATRIYKGSVVRRSGGRTLTAGEGEWTFQHPGVSGSTYATGTHCLQIAFSIDWPEQDSLLFPPAISTWKAPAHTELDHKSIRLQNMVSKELGKEDGTTYMIRNHLLSMHTFLRLRHLFYDWLISWEEVCRAHNIHWTLVPQSGTAVFMAARYLEDNPSNQPARISEMASTLGLSSRHLSYLFREHYGISLKAYHLQVKLRKAMEALKNSKLEIKEIAAQMGYSHSNFTVWIKQQTGKTPSEIRRGSSG